MRTAMEIRTQITMILDNQFLMSYYRHLELGLRLQ